jgi:thiamine biosynthesis protein ThiI
VKYELILVRYGEIGLKARHTRKRFENTLINNIKNALNREKITNNIKTQLGRIYVYTDQIDTSIKILQKIFGTTSISPAIKTTSDIKSITKAAVNISKEKITKNKSFALRVTRDGEHSYTSQDVAVVVGEAIRKATKASVNLTKPDFELFIEIRNKDTYFYIEKTRCVGGLPLGTQGKILILINTPFSILASWYLIRRGCKPVFTITNTKLQNNVSKFMKEWHVISPSILINPEKLYQILDKTSIEQKCDAIVTGHTLFDKNGLSSIENLKKQVNLPILNPLIAMDKKEIIKKCKEVGISI